MSPEGKRLTGSQKAAVLLVALGTDLSSRVLKELGEEEMERLTMEVFALESVEETLKDEILQECHQMALARRFITSGGHDYAKKMLDLALGEDKAEAVIHRLTALRQSHPLDFLRRADPDQLISFISGETPQTIALILANMEPQQAASMLIKLEKELQAEIAFRIASMGRTTPQVLEAIAQVLQKKITQVATRDYSISGGTSYLVQVINSVDRGTEKMILQSLDNVDPELAMEVRRLMFTFDDIVSLDDRSLQRVLREVDSKDLALALKNASEELKEKIFANQSSRAAEMLREDIALSGPVRLRAIEECQQRIANIVRQLEEVGEIVVTRGSDDVLV
ncbi:MAG: flagellar motor switch protein FliG [Chloroflexi bacterium]|nr:flagellar motor switch protein FliG [Chloroflexota bacterium]